MLRHLTVFLACVVCMLTLSIPTFAADDCDRACLKNALDQYMTAVTTHKPSAAPLFAGFRQTENAVVVPLGSGVWKSVTGLGKVQRQYFDAVSGQAAFYGIVEEGTSSAVVTVRIRVEDRKITEAEWYIARAGDPGLNGPAQPGQPPPNLFNPDGLAAAPPPDRVVPKAARASRELLMAITNSYFDGITSHNGAIVMADPQCDRMENGTAMGSRRRRPWRVAVLRARCADGACACASGAGTAGAQQCAARLCQSQCAVGCSAPIPGR